MKKAIEGYERFRAEVYPEQKQRFKRLAELQKPRLLFITCADSRVEPSMITQSDPGELFHCRVVGNLVPAHGSAMGGVSAAVEYAVKVLNVRHIVLCGHSDCGAMKAFLHPEKLVGLAAVEAWLEHAAGAVAVTRETHAGLEEDEFVEALTHENIVSQLQHLRTHPSVAAAVRKGTLQIHGWYYDIGTGEVTRLDEESGMFLPLEQVPE